ncbi:TIGR00341 family protein [Patescibacteria group bacterium]|nr:TIGR00341 family protein [Patescibacteria group bacterium]
MFKKLFNNITNNEQNETIERLIENSSPRREFFIMTALSSLIASFAIIMNNTAILVGAMLVAPLLYSVLSLGLGIVILDPKLTLRSLATIVKSFAICVAVSALVGFIFIKKAQVLENFFLFSEDFLVSYFIIAIISGLAGTLATVRPHMNESMPGVAISVALIPPLSTLGLALSTSNNLITRQSLYLFSLNVIGIIISSMAIFTIYQFYAYRHKVKKAVDKDEKIMEANSNSS